MYDVAHEMMDAGDDETSRRWYASAVEREAGIGALRATAQGIKG